MTDPRYTRGTASRNVVQPQWIIWVGVAFFLAGILVLVGWRQMTTAERFMGSRLTQELRRHAGSPWSSGWTARPAGSTPDSSQAQSRTS